MIDSANANTFINEDQHITGTHIWYYFICQREVWLISHQINPYEDNPYLELGRFYQEQSYQREKKSIRFENVELDLIKRKDGEYVVGEIKKSSKFLKSAKMQLAFYLELLLLYGIKAKGELLFPKEKKRIRVELSDEILQELAAAKKEIEKICNQEKPPPAKRIPFCRNCAYAEFCWA